MTSDTAAGPESALPRILPAGECALVVEYGLVVDPAIHDRVMTLDVALKDAAIPGVIEAVPTYRSLMIHFDPLRIEGSELEARLMALHPLRVSAWRAKARWTIPMCYAPDFSEDLAYIAKTLGLTEHRVVELHAGATYRLYMYGFAPGFSYLGGLPAELNISRRAEPRSTVSANKALIAGGQAIITTVPMPTGWHLLGETPEWLFRAGREPAFLLEVADELRLEPISMDEFRAIKARTDQGEIVARREALT